MIGSRAFKYNPIQDGNDVKAMPGSIPAPNPGLVHPMI